MTTDDDPGHRRGGAHLAARGSTLPIDVWVDARHLVRREQVAYEATVQGQKSGVDMTVDLTKVGVAVHAEPPPAGDVADLSALTGAGSGGTSS
jgi:hypothetical protein